MITLGACDLCDEPASKESPLIRARDVIARADLVAHRECAARPFQEAAWRQLNEGRYPRWGRIAWWTA